MTVTEMSNEFDILYNNIMSNQAPGLDEYEKSVFLTKAQSELILEYFNAKGNKFQEGFDGSERRQIDFSNLIFTKEVESVSNDSSYPKTDARSEIFPLTGDGSQATTEDDILLIVNEFLRLTREAQEESGTQGEPDYQAAVAASSKILTVVPISYLEYTRLMMKPYKLPVKSQAWRLLNSQKNNTTAGPFSELLFNRSAYEDYEREYVVRYIKRPDPIILINLADEYSDVSIEGQTAEQECTLDPIMHHDIVQRAVELAKAAYTGDLATQIQVGDTSATNLGIITSGNHRQRQ